MGYKHDTLAINSTDKQQNTSIKYGSTKDPDVSKNPQEADSKFGWLIVFGSFSNLMLSIGAITSYGVYLQEYKLVVFPNASSSFLSWIGTLQFVMMCFFGIGVSVLCERVDTRILSGIGTLVSALSLIIASFCNSPWKLLITQGILFGLGSSLLYITGLNLPPQWFVKYRALATGIAIAGSGIGGLWLSFATRTMITNLSWKWALRITGLVIIGVCGPNSLLMRTRVKPVRREKIIDLSVLHDKRFALLFFGALFGLGGFCIPYFFMPSYAVIALEKSDSWGTLIASILNGSGIVGRILSGLLGDHIGSLNILCITTLLSCLSILVLWLPFKTTDTFMAAAVIYGFFSSTIVSLIPVVVANVFGVQRLPSVMGLLMIAYGIGGLISSPPAGHILDVYGDGSNFSSLIIYNGVLLALSVLCLILLRVLLYCAQFRKV